MTKPKLIQMVVDLSLSKVRLLNEIADSERDGDASRTRTLMKELNQQMIALPMRWLANEGLAYPDEGPLQMYREMSLHPRSFSQDEVEVFAHNGFPNPREGKAFNLFLLRIPRDAMSSEALSVFLKSVGLYHASLREGFIHLRAHPGSFAHYSVHFMGSQRKALTTDHCEVPFICEDAGITLVSKHRQDPDDLLTHDVYAVVRRERQVFLH